MTAFTRISAAGCFHRASDHFPMIVSSLWQRKPTDWHHDFLCAQQKEKPIKAVA